MTAGENAALAPREEREHSIRVLELAVSLISLTFVIWWISRQGMPDFPRTTDSAVYLAASLAVYGLVSTLLRCWRWHRILMDAGIEHKRADAYSLVVVGYMGNTVLPLRGGEVLRIVLLRRTCGTPLGQGTGTVVAERVLDAVTLLLLFVLAALLQARAAAIDPIWAWAAATMLVAGAAMLAVYFALRRRGFLEPFSTRVKPVTRAAKNLLHPRGLVLLAASLGIWLADGTVFWLIGQAVGIDISLLDGVVLVVLASFFALIPAAPGYIGTYDAALAIGLKGLGVTSGPAVAFALLVRFVVYVPITITGLLLMLVRYGGLDQLRPSQLRQARRAIETESAAEA